MHGPRHDEIRKPLHTLGRPAAPSRRTSGNATYKAFPTSSEELLLSPSTHFGRPYRLKQELRCRNSTQREHRSSGPWTGCLSRRWWGTGLVTSASTWPSASALPSSSTTTP